MSSGSYFPPPVQEVEIPKVYGGTRKLGIPTIADRIAQMVVKIYLEPKVEPHFIEDSYGFRPNKSALQAVGKTRVRCWKYDWVVDIDIKGFFDNLDHELLMKAVSKHTSSRWIQLYIKRWLEAPIRRADGEVVSREKGTPQGGVISPLLANLFLHYAFDKWMLQNHPSTVFARYADDIVIHCKTASEAEAVMHSVEKRLGECNLTLHPTKTRIIYCKDDRRKENHANQKFTFLGYEFRPRKCRTSNGENFTGFNPAVSSEAKKCMSRKMRQWRIHLKSHQTIQEIAQSINPILRGWMNYYGTFHKTALRPILSHLNEIITRWVKRKYKRFRGRFQRATYWLGKIANNLPELFVHWKQVKPAAG